MSDLEQELKELIVTALALEDVTADEIDSGEPLFGDGLGLDSIDALELVVSLEKKFGVTVPNSDVAKNALATVDTIADYVEAHQSQAKA